MSDSQRSDCLSRLSRRSDMRDEGSGTGKTDKLLINTYFLNPTVQAMFLLDETGNDLQIARDMALMNACTEDIQGVMYWVAVADALIVKEQSN